MKSTHSIILIAYTCLMSAVFTTEVVAQSESNFGSGLGSGDSVSMLEPKESTVMAPEPLITVDASSTILDIAVTPTTSQTPATVELVTDIVTTTTTIGEQISSRVTSSLPASASVSPTTTTSGVASVITSSLIMSQSLTQIIISASVATPTMDSSSASILTERETTTIVRSFSEESRTTLSLTTLPTFSSEPLTRVVTLTPVVTLSPSSTLAFTPLPTIEPTPSTMVTTAVEIEVVTTTTEETITTSDDSSTTEREGDITSTGDFSLPTNKQLSTVEILVIVLAIVVFLIVLFTIASCVFAGLLCKRCIKEDPVKQEILSSWVLQEPPKRAGQGVRLMNIRTLDSMEDLSGTTGATSLEGIEMEGKPRGTVDRKLKGISAVGSNTAFTFGVPIGVTNTAETNGETTTEVESTSRQNGGSETLGDGVVHNESSGNVNSLKESKASGVGEVPQTKETTFTTNTFEPVPRPNEDLTPKSSFLSGPKAQSEQNLLSSENVEKALGTHGLFQDLEASTLL